MNNCKKCGAPPGIIGWMCDCWYDKDIKYEKSPKPKINKKEIYIKHDDIRKDRTYFLFVLGKDKYWEVNYYKNISEYAATNYLISSLDHAEGMRKIKYEKLPDLIKSEFL